MTPLRITAGLVPRTRTWPARPETLNQSPDAGRFAATRVNCETCRGSRRASAALAECVVKAGPPGGDAAAGAEEGVSVEVRRARAAAAQRAAQGLRLLTVTSEELLTGCW
ncbi:hypothetical protein RGQ21_75360 [Kitasatospora aureofaciens]|nr:hypothetical protein RGQ21_75360 [Kitasatospora aureofaciens]